MGISVHLVFIFVGGGDSSVLVMTSNGSGEKQDGRRKMLHE